MGFRFKTPVTLKTLMSVRRLRVAGVALLCDALLFVVILFLLMIGALSDREWMYYPIVSLFSVPLGVGWLVSAVHLATGQFDDSYKNTWWLRLLFGGPFAAGWYLSSLRDDG